MSGNQTRAVWTEELEALDVGSSKSTAQVTHVELAGWELREACAYWFHLARQRANIWKWTQTYNEEKYLAILERSRLKSKVKKTMTATAMTAAPQGETKVPRQAIADEVGCRRVATITAHWKAAELAGFMVSKQRFNTSNIIQLTIPPRDCRDIEGDVSRLPWPDKTLKNPPF